MKILYIFRSLAVWGGIERVLVDKMNNLVSMYGYDIYMITSCQGNHSVPYKLDNRVHLIDIDIQFHKLYQYSGLRKIQDWWQRNNLFEKRLSEQICRINPNIIVCTTADPVNLIAKVKGNIPLIVESHSVCSKTLNRKGIRQMYDVFSLLRGLKHADCLVTLTEADAADWRKFHKHVEVVPNVVCLNNGSVSSQNNKRVIWVGRFTHQKRPMEMIELWKLIYPQFPDWQLELYGEGEFSQILKETADTLGLNIHINPPTSLIFECYRKSSILVSTSSFEPFGLVIPEAMSCGLPIVAYDSFGPTSIITDGSDGFLIKMNDKVMMAKKITMLMGDASLRRTMGNAAHKSSVNYSANLIMPLWRNIFQKLLPE